MKKYKQMLLTSPRIRHLKSMVNCTLLITTICDNVTDRWMYNSDHFFCVISEVAPKSPSNPKKYFCKEISIFMHSRLSIMNDSPLSGQHAYQYTTQKYYGKTDLTDERQNKL